MEKQKKSVGTTLLVILLLIVTIAALVLATYAWAKYTEKVAENTASVQVAKWNVNATVNGTAVTEDQATNLFPLDVKNIAGNTLPSTGGMGTTILYLIGTILVLGAGILLVTRRRMSAQ